VTLLVWLVLGALVAQAPPASAHSADQSPASNFTTRVVPLTDAQREAFDFEVIEATSRVELEWRSGPPITVSDYDDRPYLRIGPDGVEENLNSNATYLNRSRLGGGVDIPDGVDPDAEPRWSPVSDTPLARWHDHRVHWMSSADPPGVLKDRSKEQLVQPWEIPLRLGDTETVVRGELRWTPGPSPVVPLAVAALLGLALLAALVLLGQRSPRRAATLGAGAAAALVAVDLVHLRGIAFGVRGTVGEGLGRMVSIGFVPIAAWVVMAVGIVLLLRGTRDAWYLVTLAAALITVVGGFADLGIVSRTAVPFAGGAALARWSVALTVGLGISLAVAGILATRVGDSAAADPSAESAT
jgi:hypothetical protein